MSAAALGRSAQAEEGILRGGVSAHRGPARGLDCAPRLDHPVAGLRRGGRCAGADRPGDGFGVDGVGLAAQSAHLAVGPVDLQHLDAFVDEVAEQPDAVAAGALDADGADGAQAARPSQELGVSVTFLRTSPLAGGQKRERVLAVDTPGGAILLSVSGLDTDQYTACCRDTCSRSAASPSAGSSTTFQSTPAAFGGAAHHVYDQIGVRWKGHLRPEPAVSVGCWCAADWSPPPC